MNKKTPSLLLILAAIAACGGGSGDQVAENRLVADTIYTGGHVHAANLGMQAVGANLLAEPDGDVATIDDVVQKLQEFAAGDDIERTGWIFGVGYDDSILVEKRHPTRDDLDRVSTELPVIATHISGHFAAVNSKGLELVGFDADTADPEGGIIRRRPDSQEPNGVLEELAAIPVMMAAISPKTLDNTHYLQRMVELEMTASLFPMHTYYWGDWHSEIIGEALGQQISPTRTALDLGLPLTSHTDAPVALPNLMQVVWATVNRTSRSGKIIGPAERLTALEAMKSITLWGARQHFEEDRKGSIEVGKLADLVVLSENPLTIEPDRLNDIVVLKTIKAGETVWERAAN